MTQIHVAYYRSEIGPLEITGSEEGILSVAFVDEAGNRPEVHPCLQECLEQLDQYFRGQRREFSLELQLEGTTFQKKVWRQLMAIPFGRTASYKDIAVALGHEKAVRAVGNASGKNKMPIIIPCHRVIGSNGRLVGYGGGLWRKAWLLNHERSVRYGKQLALFSATSASPSGTSSGRRAGR